MMFLQRRLTTQLRRPFNRPFTNDHSPLKRTLPSLSLEGRNVVVTGGAGGLGLIMSEAILESGGEVAIVDLNGELAEKQAADLVERFQKTGANVRVTGHQCDVAKASSVAAAMKDILKEHSKVDGLVTSAGFCENFPATTYPHERYHKLMGVNIDGTFFWATEVARHLREVRKPGSMVLIASMSASIINRPQLQTPYNVSKAAVKHMAASLATEWALDRIRVNSLSPGYMATALTKAIIDREPDIKDHWVGGTPMARLGEPEDLKGAIVYLLSDASSFCTGIDHVVDGGYSLY